MVPDNKGIDRDKILRLLESIEIRLQKLKELQSLSPKEFDADFRNTDAAIYNLQSAIEAMIDLGNHIIARVINKTPKTYGDTFRILSEAGLLEATELTTYVAMSKFRNRVVHMYDEVTPDQVYEILRDHLQDFTKFIKQIKVFLEN